jgi:hypothetical protein
LGERGQVAWALSPTCWSGCRVPAL